MSCCALARFLAATAARELSDLGVRALAVECDVTQPESIDRAIAEVVGQFGRIDILLNNAGISWGVPFEQTKLSKWDFAFSAPI